MRTKKILLTAVLTAATTLGALAADNVYSVNVVGYVTKQLVPGLNLIAMPLKQTNYTLGYLLPAPPDQTLAYILSGGSYGTYTYYADLPGWDPEGGAMPLGSGAFIFAPSAFSATFVGEVAQGGLTNTITGGLSIQSSQVPQQTNVSVIGLRPMDQDLIYKWDAGAQAFGTYTYYVDLPGWDPGDAAGPTMDVGEAFIFFSGTPGAQLDRTFTVN